VKKLRLVLGVMVFLFSTVGSAATVNTDLIYATDGEQNLIRVYDTQGSQVSTIANPDLNFPSLLEGFNGGQSLITNINFVPGGGPDLVKLDLQGNILSRTTSRDIFGANGGGIIDVINSGSDTFFITSTLNTQVAEIDSNLNLIRRFPSGATNGGLRTLGGAVTNDGSLLYIADADGQSGNGFVRIFDTVTGNQIDSITNNGIEFPITMEFDLNGNLYITDRGGTSGEDKILVFSDSNILIDEFNSGAPIYANFGWFDLDSLGNLVMLETNFDTDSPIRILQQDGTFIREFGDGLNNPHGILVMPVVPVPAAAWLFGTGLLGLIGFSRRRKST